MISVKLLNRNNIVTLEKEGKIPIKSSQGFMFYNPNELLCATIGACIGRNMVIYCSQNNIDITTFETIGVDMEHGKVKVVIQYPDNIDEETLKGLKSNIEKCEMITMLQNGIDIKVELLENKTPIDKIKEMNAAGKPCCGG